MLDEISKLIDIFFVRLILNRKKNIFGNPIICEFKTCNFVIKQIFIYNFANS